MIGPTIRFQASKFKMIEDKEGECRLTLLIPQSEAKNALSIPTETLLNVSIEVGEE